MGDCVTTDVKRTVDGASAEAETMDVTTFTDEGWTVVVEAAMFDSTCDETDCAIEEEMAAWTDDVAAFVDENADDEALLDVAGAVSAMIS